MPAFRTLMAMSALVAAGTSHAAEAPAKSVEQFLGRYCLECHDAEVQKGGRAFHQFKLPLKTLPTVIEARDMVDQLTLREMPPKKAAQPTDEERLAAVRALRAGTVDLDLQVLKLDALIRATLPPIGVSMLRLRFEHGAKDEHAARGRARRQRFPPRCRATRRRSVRPRVRRTAR